jgi:hypothetical protein
MVNNSTNINRTKNHLSTQVIEVQEANNKYFSSTASFLKLNKKTNMVKGDKSLVFRRVQISGNNRILQQKCCFGDKLS